MKADERRHNKATGPTTTLGICVPRRPEQGLLYDRLPLPVASNLRVGLNAQFDTDTARSTLHERAWNAHRFAELGVLLAAVALELFSHDARRAWGAVPLLHDVPDGISEWLRERFLFDVIGRCHLRLADELRLGPEDTPRPLDEIVFEDSGLDGVLTGSDQERLAEGFSAVPPTQRDRFGRWRRVLQELGRHSCSMSKKRSSCSRSTTPSSGSVNHSGMWRLPPLRSRLRCSANSATGAASSKPWN